MRAIEFITESADQKLPSLETFFEAEWDREPVKHYSPKQAYDIHRDEELPGVTSFNQSVVKYTGQTGAKWNNFLHKQYRGKANPTDFKRYQEHIADVDAALAKNILKKDYTLYTGLRESPADAFDLYNHPRTSPIPVHLPAYTSTTTSWKVAVEFASYQHGVGAGRRSQHELLSPTGKKLIKKPTDIEKKITIDILRIFVPSGTTGGSLANTSYNTSEDEILLPRGLDIIISPKPQVIEEYNQIVYLWNAKVVGHRPQPVEIGKKS